MEEHRIILYKTQEDRAAVSLYTRDGSVWMNPNQLAELFDTSKQNIGQHIKSILEDNELDTNSVVKNYFTTAADGKNYETAMEQLVDKVYQTFDSKRKLEDSQMADEQDLEALKALESKIKSKKK
jgi:hypothetical protein